MKVTVLKGTLEKRDEELQNIPHNFFTETNIMVYRNSTGMKNAAQVGIYRSRQGATITPVPFWSIEFQNIRRKAGDGYQILPSKDSGAYMIRSARWSTNVVGTGTEKEKWRGLSLEGKCSLSNVFSVVSSSWLVPFALANRYLIHIPAEMRGKDKTATISIRHDYAQDSKGLQIWTNTEASQSEIAIRYWTGLAQQAWKKKKTDLSSKLVTERLDYHSTLSSQKPLAIRVVHTRSRSFYASVLNPKAKTALGIPFCSVKLNTIEKENIINSTYLPISGVICDNLLHFIDVGSEDEAYWMSGLFNSKIFCKAVMKNALGEPPGIYSIPAKVMHSMNLSFDPTDSNHVSLSNISRILEKKMEKTLSDYLFKEKGVNIGLVDDSDNSPEVPSTISSAMMRRLNANSDLQNLEELATQTIKKSKN
jgi:hypothetical protein